MTSESPRKFLSDITAIELSDLLDQTEQTAYASGTVARSGIDIIKLQESELEKYYPGIHEFIFARARIFRETGGEREFLSGYLAGAILMARSITLASEAHEMPEL